MNKILPLLVVGILVLSGFGVAAVTTNKATTVTNNNATMDNQPPNTPEIAGPITFKIGVEYNFYFVTTDPDGDNISYYIDWDDGTMEEWGPFASGLVITSTHAFYEKRDYIIRAKAIDHPYGAESDWGYLWLRWKHSSQQSSSIPSSQSVMNVIPSTGNMVFNNDTTPPVTTIYFTPATPIGENGWYVSDVTITLEATDDMSGVDVIKYLLDDSDWLTYTGPFTVESDGCHRITYYAIDKAGNVEQPSEVIRFGIDQTPPTIELTVEKIGFRKWLITADVYDETSGINRVEFYVDGEFIGEVTEAPYELVYTGTGYGLQIVVYDNAGNEAISDPVPVSYSQSQSQSSSNLVLVRISGICLGGLTGIQNIQRRV